MKKLLNIPKDYVYWGDTKEQVHKYVPLNRVLSVFDREAILIVKNMLPFLHHKHKNILVDYKVRYLEAGSFGCPLPDWHYDCVKDFDHPSKHEHHLLYTNVDGTLFLDGENIIKAGDSEIWEYGRELHASPKMIQNCKRVLIRVTETDTIR